MQLPACMELHTKQHGTCIIVNFGDVPSLRFASCVCQLCLLTVCLLQILKPAEKKQKFAVTGAGNRPGTPPRAGAKAGVAPAAPAAAATKA